MPRYCVIVPVKTTQSFMVEAASPTGAKRKVTAWLNGERDDHDDLAPNDDIGMVSQRVGTRYWTVESI
jgi:hypothetical protein